MAAILQHVPRFIDDAPETATFDTLDQLLAIPWVARFREPTWGNFYRFSLDGPRLVVEYDKGATWNVVGILSGAMALTTSLPRWRGFDNGAS